MLTREKRKIRNKTVTNAAQAAGYEPRPNNKIEMCETCSATTR